jgi:hypothetical protein
MKCMSCHQNVGQNGNVKEDNNCFQNVAKLKYLEMIITNQNYAHKKSLSH